MSRSAVALIVVGACALSIGCSDDSTPNPAPVVQTVVRNSVARIHAALPKYRGVPFPTDTSPALAGPRKSIQDGHADKALSELEALAPKDTTGEAAFLMGWLHHEKQRFALALPYFEAALESGPRYRNAHYAFFYYGRCLQETGDLTGARAAYEASNELLPDQAAGIFRLALLDMEAGDLELCESRARAALELFERPRDVAKTHALLADIHLARDEPELARDALVLCVETFPHYEVFYRLSRLSARLGEDEDAARYLEQHRIWRARAGR